jgi:hypothetical protein
MSERRIRLDIASGGRADHEAQRFGAGEQHNSASEEQVDRFRRALTSGAAEGVDTAGDPASGIPASPSRNGARPRGAFDLFGRAGSTRGVDAQLSGGAETLLASAGLQPAAAMPSAQGEAPEADLADGSAERFAYEVAERILVSADDQQEVRVLIRDDVLPGVELRMCRADGRWVVGFTVTDAASFALIEQAGDRIASDLATRLESGVEVRLTGPEDLEAGEESYQSFFAHPRPSVGPR